MHVYVASSWKMEIAARWLGEMLRPLGHTVYVFCDTDAPACKVSMELRRTAEARSWNAKEALSKRPVQEIFVNDTAELNKADCVLLLLPSGKSAHVEAGIKKGQGKLVVVYGPVVPGDWDTMYLAFDAFFTTEETEAMYAWFKERGTVSHDSGGRAKQSVTAAPSQSKG